MSHFLATVQRQHHGSVQRDTPPENASRLRIRYAPGEVRDARRAAGTVDERAQLERVLGGFAVNDASVRPAHAAFIEQVIRAWDLTGPSPRAQLELVEGYTDLVDTEDVNHNLRTLRANAVADAFLQRGVPARLLGTVQGAPPGSLLRGNTTPAGRAGNRAVLIRFNLINTASRPPAAQPDTRSRHWALTANATLTFGTVAGGGGGLFTLDDLDHPGTSRTLMFVGAGLAGGARLPRVPQIPARPSMSLPGGTRFHTSRPVAPSDFNHVPGTLICVGVGIFFIAYGEGVVGFLPDDFTVTADEGGPGPTNAYAGTPWVDIGGVSAGPIGASAAGISGIWQLMP